jgi:transcriptional regulator with XRE-family HTH domain
MDMTRNSRSRPDEPGELPPREAIGERLKVAMSDAGMTYDEAASVGGVARSTIQRIVGGKGSMDLEVVARISAKIDVSIDYIVFGKSAPATVGLREIHVLEAAELIVRAAPSFAPTSAKGKLDPGDIAVLIVERAKQLRADKLRLTDTGQ